MYRILSATLRGYRRMLLNEIREITITPESAVQLILGTNGCGKSSLLEQLTPLPAEQSAFIKGGGKIIHIHSNGHHFVCSSTFVHGAEHSFMMDGEELNPGGTATVQRDLCKKYFNVTPASHDLIRGFEKFHLMSAAKRREWLMNLCGTDYEFALSAYDKLRERSNHLTGALKMNKKNLVVETAKIMSPAEEEKLETEVNELLAELAILQSERQPVTQTSEHFLNERGRALQALDDVAMRLLRTRVVAPYEYADGRVVRDDWGMPKKAYFTSLDEVDMEIDRLKHIVTDRQATFVVANEQFTKLQRQCDILVKTGAEGVDSLNKQIDELRQEITTKVNKLRLGLVFKNARGAQEALDSIELPFTTLLREIPANEDRRFGRKKHEELMGLMRNAVDAGNQTADRIYRLTAQKEHADLHRGENKHTCPQCNHTWIVGVNEEQYGRIAQRLKEEEATLAGFKAKQAELQVEIDKIEAYFTQYREIMAFTRNVGILAPFWEYLINTQLIFDSPLEAANLVHQVMQDIIASVEIEDREKKIDELVKLRLAAAEVGDANLNEVRAQLDVLTEQIGKLSGELAQASRAVNDYSEYRRNLNTGLQLGEEVKRLYGLAEKHQYDHIEMFRRESIQHCIREVENALSLKQESLRAVKMQKSVVESLTAQLSQIELHEAAAKTMVKALSPTHGLIAEGLLGFIRAFVGEMNSFINRFWSYPLQIIPTGYDSESGEQTAELDYKFKVIVERENNIIKDVSLGSEGIKEVIDLAFKMVAIKYLNLSDTPLMLDEFGRAFDDEHRVAATAEIGWLMENGNHPQLFMISHYSHSYTAFQNSQVCVIDDRNVSIPAGMLYNEHVTITH